MLVDNFNDQHVHWINYPCSSVNINKLEMIPVWLALQRYAEQCHNTHIVVYTDNNQVLANINTGISSNINTIRLLREMFWLCVVHNLYVTARRIASIDNMAVDALSRLKQEDTIRAINVLCLCCS